MKTLALVFGGESCEHDISVITALSVYNAIKNRFQVYPVYLKEGLFWTGEALKDVSFYAEFDIKKLKETTFRPGLMVVKKRFGYAHYKIDCVLVCNHGGVGENGSLSGYFEIVGIPYTSSDPVGSGICMDKVLTKYFLEKFRFPVVNYRVYRKGGKVSKVEELGYPVILKPARLGSSVGISYVRNREELEKGHIEEVNQLLGYTYFTKGEIVHGRQLGRTIGIPTANLIPPVIKKLPPNGVYITESLIQGKTYQGITNIGYKPTVKENFLGVETYLFSCNADLYGQEAEVRFYRYLRPEIKFSSLEELKCQMLKDIEEGKSYFRLKK